MSRYQDLSKALENRSSLWLITGVAGFIGSNLLEQLLRLNQKVVGLDDFSTGSHENLIDVKRAVSDKQWSRFRLIEGNIKELAVCKQACVQVDYVLHHAALGSVPISVDDPLRSNETNVTGFLNMLVAAQEEGVKRFVYAASSSTYGDHPNQPHVEDQIGKPLSPYAVTKYVNELYAEVFTKTYAFHAVGLRYFNVFGKRQSPEGMYAAVIPNWIAAMLKGKAITIFGDGLTSRDFCFVDDVVQANLLVALAPPCDKHEIYNVALARIFHKQAVACHF